MYPVSTISQCTHIIYMYTYMHVHALYRVTSCHDHAAVSIKNMKQSCTAYSHTWEANQSANNVTHNAQSYTYMYLHGYTMSCTHLLEVAAGMSVISLTSSYFSFNAS